MYESYNGLGRTMYPRYVIRSRDGRMNGDDREMHDCICNYGI